MDCKELGEKIQKKAKLNSIISNNTIEAFNLFKESAKNISDELSKGFPDARFDFENKGEFEFELRFGSDILVFLLHPDVFEFSRLHDVMKIPYVKEDLERSYCGMINIYNFLTDSFDYNRDLDVGYMIGRVFVNKESHYFIEGKREVGLLYTNFNTSVIDKDSVTSIIKSAMEYANNFDLLTPPFDDVKIVTVAEIQSKLASKKQITGKRLGFEFKQDRS